MTEFPHHDKILELCKAISITNTNKHFQKQPPPSPPSQQQALYTRLHWKKKVSTSGSAFLLQAADWEVGGWGKTCGEGWLGCLICVRWHYMPTVGINDVVTFGDGIQLERKRVVLHVRFDSRKTFTNFPVNRKSTVISSVLPDFVVITGLLAGTVDWFMKGKKLQPAWPFHSSLSCLVLSHEF